MLEPLSAAGSWLFALGVVICLLRPGERGRSLCLAAFSVYYAAALFFVLPELKHAGPLVLPLSVFGGVGLAFVPRGLWRVVRAALRASTPGAGGRGRRSDAGLGPGLRRRLRLQP
jgi:hypothetical protein